MKLRNQVCKYGRKVAGAVAGVALMVGSAAHAAGIDISAQTTQSTTDVNSTGVLVLGVIVAAATFGWLRRVIK
jgi:putative effector of murein hydrolase